MILLFGGVCKPCALRASHCSVYRVREFRPAAN
jgi:hypothetical protein